MGPCTSMMHTWDLEGLLYPYFGTYVCTMEILGPFRKRIDVPMEASRMQCIIAATSPALVVQIDLCTYRLLYREVYVCLCI